MDGESGAMLGGAVAFSYSGLTKTGGTQVITTDTDTEFAFTTNSPAETGGDYFAAGTPTRTYIPTTGLYRVAAWIDWTDGLVAGVRYAYILSNVIGVIAMVKEAAPIPVLRKSIVATRIFAVGDYLTLRFYHTAGADVTVKGLIGITKVAG